MTAVAKVAAAKPVAQREITVTRTFDAPRKLVFSMLTDAKHLAAWWGPHGWNNPMREADPRPGGKILIHMQGPDGTAHPMGGVFTRSCRTSASCSRPSSTCRTASACIEVAQHGHVRGQWPARPRSRCTPMRSALRISPRRCSPAWRPAGRRASTSSPRMRRARPARKDADDQAAIRGIFGDRTNALFGKVVDLAVKHFADDVVSYDLDPPLQHVGPNREAMQAWFDTWDGPIAWAMGDTAGRDRRRYRDRARARPHDRHQEGRRKGRSLGARHDRSCADRRRVEDHAPAHIGAVQDGRQLQGRGRFEALSRRNRRESSAMSATARVRGRKAERRRADESSTSRCSGTPDRRAAAAGRRWTGMSAHVAQIDGQRISPIRCATRCPRSAARS